MENEFQIFESEEFGTLRTVVINDVAWFAGKDAAISLKYKDTDQAIRVNVDDEDKIILKQKDLEKMASESNPVQNTNFKIDSPRGLIFINISGLFSLILFSKLPTAKKFQHWVTSEVLPNIYKLGIYSTKNILNKLLESAKYAETIQNLKCVYVFEMNNGTVKIGYTQNIRQRMCTIISNSGLDITKVYYTDFFDSEIAYTIEQTCHEIFEDYRVRGEFFKISFDEACTELKNIVETLQR